MGSDRVYGLVVLRVARDRARCCVRIDFFLPSSQLPNPRLCADTHIYQELKHCYDALWQLNAHSKR